MAALPLANVALQPAADSAPDITAREVDCVFAA